jgi:gliding motility-associated protein GldM
MKSVADLKMKDNKSKSTAFMINDGNAEKLKKQLEIFRTEMLSFVDEQDRAAMLKIIGIDVNDDFFNTTGTPETWEEHYFDNVIFAAGVTLLSKTVGEVRNAESGILRYVIRSITKDDFNFSSVKAKVIATSQLVFQGETYEADIIVAAYDDKQSIDAYWRPGTGVSTSKQGASYIRGAQGVAKLIIPTNSVGDFAFSGFIEMINPRSGVAENYPFLGKYTVMAPAATVAADKVNVLYAGIENPVSVTASVPPERVSISLTGGTYTKTGPGHYNITVPENLAGREITVNILADIDGRQRQMGSKNFRIKRVPNPVAVLGGNISGRVNKQELLANPFILADMGQDFVYDLKWTVNSYQVTFIVRGIEDAPILCNSRQFPETVRNKIQNAASGTMIWFENIQASTPGISGSRTLNPITVKLR